jgi:hypothetical protein
MALDDTQLIYSSNWQIEQVVKHATVTIPAGSGTDTLIASWGSIGLTVPSRTVASAKYSSDAAWRILGASLSDDPFLSGEYVLLKLKTDGLYCTSFSHLPVDVRYTIYKDKVEIP